MSHCLIHVHLKILHFRLLMQSIIAVYRHAIILSQISIYRPTYTLKLEQILIKPKPQVATYTINRAAKLCTMSICSPSRKQTQAFISYDFPWEFIMGFVKIGFPFMSKVQNTLRSFHIKENFTNNIGKLLLVMFTTVFILLIIQKHNSKNPLEIPEGNHSLKPLILLGF